jgi:hypothetical protein
MTHEQFIESQGLRAGDILPNGWTVIDAAGDSDHAVVLAINSNNAHPYATWFARLGDYGWVTYWGEYYGDLDTAIADYNDRINA